MKDFTILWEQTPVRPWEEAYRTFFLQALEALGGWDWDISVTFCDDEFIRTLNRDFRHKDEPTDILSFPQEAEDRPDLEKTQGLVLGDLIISLDTLRGNAAYFQVAEEEELKRLTLHGILHLQGWDHATNESFEPMLVRQEEILKQFSGVKIFT